jgi:hypothetical protein
MLFVPSVKSITSFLLQTTNIGSLPRLRILLCPLGLVPVLPLCVVCVGITPNDELLFPAVPVVSDVPHFLSG